MEWLKRTEKCPGEVGQRDETICFCSLTLRSQAVQLLPSAETWTEGPIFLDYISEG